MWHQVKIYGKAQIDSTIKKDRTSLLCLRQGESEDRNFIVSQKTAISKIEQCSNFKFTN